MSTEALEWCSASGIFYVKACAADSLEAIINRGLHIGYMKKAPHHDSKGLFQSGAGEMNRTPDLLITNELVISFAIVDGRR